MKLHWILSSDSVFHRTVNSPIEDRESRVLISDPRSWILDQVYSDSSSAGSHASQPRLAQPTQSGRRTARKQAQLAPSGRRTDTARRTTAIVGTNAAVSNFYHRSNCRWPAALNRLNTVVCKWIYLDLFASASQLRGNYAAVGSPS